MLMRPQPSVLGPRSSCKHGYGQLQKVNNLACLLLDAFLQATNFKVTFVVRKKQESCMEMNGWLVPNHLIAGISGLSLLRPVPHPTTL